MLKSMTGYGRAQKILNGRDILVDHVANMYWSYDCSCDDNVIDHALIT